MVDLEGLTRRELQSLAKEHDVKVRAGKIPSCLKAAFFSWDKPY